MAVALRVIQHNEEAHVEALSALDEAAETFDDLYQRIQSLEARYRLRGRIVDPSWRKAEWIAARGQRRALEAAATTRSLFGGDAA